ncbi:MAG: hypothetical protein HKO65_06875 [Gemmatimonadetes bacterium]|nr:hypothetical protein [Gemmatimonadota bacterium]NNM04811.1 hypothetical protein [Gemmatimonadota bacterium]
MKQWREDPFRDAGFPAILVIENSLPDFWDANAAYHTLEDASDRLAEDPASPSPGRLRRKERG